MPRLSFKPDASFFRKIVVGAVGARAVVADLASHGHCIVELERGSTDTKLWKDVKRKRVRIPDLLCVNCGRRIECRAKTKLELAMSHSPTDAERAWDFGMVDGDWITFPFCQAAEEVDWSSGSLDSFLSYWREKSWARWQPIGSINYFTVAAFRSNLHSRSRTKGVEEGSENIIAWDATFSTREGIVEKVDPVSSTVTVRRNLDGHRYTWTIKGQKSIYVAIDDAVGLNQVLASAVPPLARSEFRCPRSLPANHISQLFGSRERTQRFTGVKLARLVRDANYREQAQGLADDDEEDVYVRLEAVSYLTAVCGLPARSLFSRFLQSADEPTELEAVIALGEAANDEAVAILCEIVDNANASFFLRSAATWALSRTVSSIANQQLVKCFADVNHTLREEALDGLVAIGDAALPTLLQGLRESDGNIAAGCAEAIRRADAVPTSIIEELIAELNSPKPQDWAVWLVAHLPRDHFASSIASLQSVKPELHYATSILWAFIDSWIARNWELHPKPIMP